MRRAKLLKLEMCALEIIRRVKSKCLKKTKITKKIKYLLGFFSSVQSLSRVRLFVTPWITAHQASLSITNSRSSLKLMSTESVMPSSHPILCRGIFSSVQSSRSVMSPMNHSTSGLPVHHLLPDFTQTHVHCVGDGIQPAHPLQRNIQFSSVAQLYSTLCNPMNHSTPSLPVHHQLPEFTQTHVHRVGDGIQPCHALSSPSPPALNLSQHQGLFQWVNSSHEVAKVLEFQL